MDHGAALRENGRAATFAELGIETLMALTLNERLMGVRAGLHGAGRRIKDDLDRLEEIEKELKITDPALLTMYRLCIRSIRSEADELIDLP